MTENGFSNVEKLGFVIQNQLCFNPLPDDKFQTLPNYKSLQTTISNLMKMAENYPNR